MVSGKVTSGLSSESGNSIVTAFTLKPPSSEMLSHRGPVLRSLRSLLGAVSLYLKDHNFLIGPQDS